jgi:hydroxyacylglutathione hydrolase
MYFAKRFISFMGLVVFIIPVLGPALQGQNNQTGAAKTIAAWFKATAVAENVWCIDDHGGDNCYLVAGSEKALLIDTGTGVADLDSVVKSITDLPLIVVNTHGHPDHAGGNYQFKQVYAHPADFELIKQFTAVENIKNARVRAAENAPGLQSALIKQIDAFDVASLIPVKSEFIFDLGGRKLEVIEVPGHTPGSICLLDANNKLLFTGDNNNTIVWLFLDGCLPVEAYMQMLEKLDSRAAEFDTLLPGHGAPLDAGFIGEQIICAQNILKGECQGERYDTFVGPALICRYKRAGIAFDAQNLFIKK